MRDAVFGLMLAVAPFIHAATVWTGPLITFNQPSSDPTQSTNQDRIAPDVWLTRAASKGLFNAFNETNATVLSPANTEWAFGALTNHALLHYTNWLAWLNGASPTTLVGQPAVVHLLPDDIYISVQFTKWIPSGTGGFAYQRSTPAPAMLAGASVNDGQFTFSYGTEAGFSYVVQSSSDLVNWAPMVTNTGTGGSVLISNTLGLTGSQFYRMGRIANP